MLCCSNGTDNYYCHQHYYHRRRRWKCLIKSFVKQRSPNNTNTPGLRYRTSSQALTTIAQQRLVGKLDLWLIKEAYSSRDAVPMWSMVESSFRWIRRTIISVTTRIIVTFAGWCCHHAGLFVRSLVRYVRCDFSKSRGVIFVRFCTDVQRQCCNFWEASQSSTSNHHT